MYIISNYNLIPRYWSTFVTTSLHLHLGLSFGAAQNKDYVSRTFTLSRSTFFDSCAYDAPTFVRNIQYNQYKKVKEKSKHNSSLTFLTLCKCRICKQRRLLSVRKSYKCRDRAKYCRYSRHLSLLRRALFCIIYIPV